MSVHNYILASNVICARCKACIPSVRAESYVGYQRLLEYRVGSRVRWAQKKIQGITRPPEGCGEFDGYVVCPVCERDFWLRVLVEHDVITSVATDPDREGSIS